MNMMIYSTMDLMAAEVPEDEIGLIRQASWHEQSIGQIGNMVAIPYVGSGPWICRASPGGRINCWR